MYSAAKSSSSLSVATTTTSSTSEQSQSCRDNIKKHKASGILISAVGNSPLRVGLEANDDPKRMLKLLDARYGSGRTDSTTAVQTQLFCMRYTEQNKLTYVDKYTLLFTQLEQMRKDAAIPESLKASILLASIDIKSSLESTAASLRTKDASDLTWEYIATTLTDEYNSRQDPTESSSSSNKGRPKRKKKSKA